MQTIEISDVQEKLMNDLKEIDNDLIEVETHGPFGSTVVGEYTDKKYNMDTVNIKFKHFELYLQGEPYLDEVASEPVR